MNKKEEIKVDDLIEAISFLGNRITHGTSIYEYSESPIHIMVHNEIMKFSKDELEKSKASTHSGAKLWNISFYIRNPYILSAFLEKGAFVNKLSNNSKWLLNVLDEPNKDIYQVIYDMEETKFRYSPALYSEQKQLHYWILDYFCDMNDSNHIKVIDKYLKEFGEKDSSKILKFIVKNYSSKHKDFFSYVVSKLKLQGIDIENNNFLNYYLPETEKYSDTKNKFFISSSNFDKIKDLLEIGFRFDEKKYSFNGDNLFIAVLKGNNKILTDIIVPYLTNIKSKKMDEQNQFIEDFDKAAPSSFAWIKKQYDYLAMNLDLNVNEGNKTKRLKV
jgi:hypothetical protein